MIIIGATSGIGASLARQAVSKGYLVGGTGRREERLISLKNELGDSFFYKVMDVTERDKASTTLNELVEEMGGMHIIVLNSGISNYPSSSVSAMEQEIIDVNVSGFVNLFGQAFNYFKEQRTGHIVGISSIASLFGSSRAAPYCGSKAFISTYMQGYRQRVNASDRLDITITDVKPGFVKSEMTDGKKGLFWLGETDVAVRQILKDIERKKSYSYVTRRWRFIAWLIKLTPNLLLDRLKIGA